MSNELTTIFKHRTWDLVLSPSNCTQVGCRRVFKVKRKSNCYMDRLRYCLVAKGYNQCPRLDDKETFNAIVKLVTIRLVLTIIVMNG